MRVEPHDFEKLVAGQDEPLVVFAEGGVLAIDYQYLTLHKGLVFFMISDSPLYLPARAEVIAAKAIPLSDERAVQVPGGKISDG